MGRKNSIEKVYVEGVDYPNKGYGTVGDKKVHFKGGVPGRQVNVKITRGGTASLKGKILEVLEHSPWENETPCPAFGLCGGCTYQRLDYVKELEHKKQQIEKLFVDNNIEIKDIPINPSPLLHGYRNKMEYTFGDQGKGTELMLGLHARGRFYEVVDTTGCNLVHPDFERIRQAAVDYGREQGLSYYRKMNHKGYLRHLVVRLAMNTGQLMVNLVTSSQDQADLSIFVEKLRALPLENTLASVLHTTNDSPADAIVPEELEILYGIDFIVEKMNDLEFKISPFSFFQPNVQGASKLYNKAAEYVGEEKDALIYDLYSGTGTISQVLAKNAKKVVGVEIVEEAVEASIENAKRNSIDNIEFIQDDVLNFLQSDAHKADIILLDPPREGVHSKAVEKIIAAAPRKIIYISCNPASFVRDAYDFLQAGYEIVDAEIFDQFPRTVHVETVVLMSRVNK